MDKDKKKTATTPHNLPVTIKPTIRRYEYSASDKVTKQVTNIRDYSLPPRSAFFWDITQRTEVIPTFRDTVSVASSRVSKSGIFILEDGTDTFSRNVGKGLPLYAA